MRTLFFTDSLVAGGKERRLIELMKALKLKPNIEFELVVMSNEIHYQEVFYLDIKIHYLIRTTKKDLTVFHKFYKICKNYKPDIVHCWDSMIAVIAVPACKLLNIKLVNGMVVDTPVKRNIFNKHWFLAKLTFHFPAWSCGIPVLSLFVDPGGIIKKEELGDVTHGNPDKLLLAMENSVNTVEFANRAKAYVENDHVLNAKKIKEVSFLFSDLFNNGK